MTHVEGDWEGSNGTPTVVEPPTPPSTSGREEKGVKKNAFSCRTGATQGAESRGSWTASYGLPAFWKSCPSRRGHKGEELLRWLPRSGSKRGTCMQTCCFQQWGGIQWCNWGLSSHHLVWKWFPDVGGWPPKYTRMNYLKQKRKTE